MKKLSDAGDLIALTELKDLLEEEGIPCMIKNEFTIGLSGEIPLNESSPELWVADASDEPRARQLIQEFRAAESQPGKSWTCPACSEWVEGQFTSCWKCGGAKPAAA